jgi:hypothetical protein
VKVDGIGVGSVGRVERRGMVVVVRLGWKEVVRGLRKVVRGMRKRREGRRGMSTYICGCTSVGQKISRQQRRCGRGCDRGSLVEADDVNAQPCRTCVARLALRGASKDGRALSMAFLCNHEVGKWYTYE